MTNWLYNKECFICIFVVNPIIDEICTLMNIAINIRNNRPPGNARMTLSYAHSSGIEQALHSIVIILHLSCLKQQALKIRSLSQ